MARKKRKFASEKDLANIDRFAGSSEEDDDDEQNEDEEGEADHDDSTREASKNLDDDPDAVSDEESNNDSDDDDPVVIQTGMASVMQRLLSSRPAAGASTAVLSKTKTKLQVQAAQALNAEKDLQQRKKANREKKLVAMHIPLTGDKITEEVERERTHKRIATKGVVALFNAITQHQQPKETPVQQLSKTSKAKDQQLTKDNFLDMIKKKATASTPAVVDAAPAPKKWEALRDDFKLENAKNWDEESSEDEAMDDSQ